MSAVITMEELKELSKMSAKLNQNEQILTFLKRRAENPSLADYGIADITELESESETLRASVLSMQERVEAYIAWTPDAHMRIALRHHYLEGLTWADTATISCWFSYESCRKAAQRNHKAYMRAHEEAGSTQTADDNGGHISHIPPLHMRRIGPLQQTARDESLPLAKKVL
jgi:hypothetical protein